jgi:hypothetical protein
LLVFAFEFLTQWPSGHLEVLKFGKSPRSVLLLVITLRSFVWSLEFSRRTDDH